MYWKVPPEIMPILETLFEQVPHFNWTFCSNLEKRLGYGFQMFPISHRQILSYNPIAKWMHRRTRTHKVRSVSQAATWVSQFRCIVNTRLLETQMTIVEFYGWNRFNHSESRS